MAKVYDFPTKEVYNLPEEIKQRLYQVAKDYVKVLHDILPSLNSEDMSGPEYEDLVELVAATYAEGIIIAANELE